MKLSERAIIRKQAGLTQHQLSRLSGLPSSRISLWENGEFEFDTADVAKIANVLAKALNRVPAASTSEEIAKVLAGANSKPSVALASQHL